MKSFLFLIISFYCFTYPSIGQNQINRAHYLDNTTKNLASVAKWLKNLGQGSQDKFYEYFILNQKNLHHIKKTNIEMDGILHDWDFYDSGLIEIKKAGDSKKTYVGEWGAINADHVKFHVQSQDRESEILFYESQTGKLFIQIQSEQSSSKITQNQTEAGNLKPPLNKDDLRKKRIAAGIDIKTTEGNLSDWRWRPDKCLQCKGSGIVKVCWNCEKRGYRYCFSCSGKRYERNGTVCINCAGQGVVTCQYCRGQIFDFKCQHWFILTFDALERLK